MRIVIAGATGFIGKRLCEKLSSDYELTALTRDAAKSAKSLVGKIRVVKWDAKTLGGWEKEIEGAMAVVNLTGGNIAGRWTEKKKSRIIRSRIDSCRAIIEAVKRANDKPKVIVLASAIGYYGSQKDALIDETSRQGDGFLAEVCGKVESFAEEIENCGVRCVIIRTGMVIGWDGGVLVRFIPPFKFFLGDDENRYK